MPSWRPSRLRSVDRETLLNHRKNRLGTILAKTSELNMDPVPPKYDSFSNDEQLVVSVHPPPTPPIPVLHATHRHERVPPDLVKKTPCLFRVMEPPPIPAGDGYC